MSINKNYQIRARSALLDEKLIRPDWTKIQTRDMKLLWLDKNENIDPGMNKLTTQIFENIDPKSVSVYPECGPLYIKLADSLGVDPHCILLASGADGVIRSVFETFVNSGDTVIHTKPSYAMYEVYSRMYGARTHLLEYQQSDDGPVLTAKKIIETILDIKPKLICLPNPDSPTGTVISSDSMREIIKVAGVCQSIVLVDEAYYPFYPESVLPLLLEFPHLVIVRTFSKAWGLTGVRLGYGVSSPEVTQLLHKTRPNYEVNQIAISMAMGILDHNQEMLEAVARLNEGRDSFVVEMNKLGFHTLKSEGNFLLVAFGNWSKQIHEALKGLVLYRTNFEDPCLKGFSRFSSTTVQLFEPIIAKIKEVVLSNS